MYPIFDKKKNASITPSEKAYITKRFKWEWYEPPQESLPVHFCVETSLHGLKYLGQPGRHLCERIFWFTAFTAAVITATVLIWGLYQVYRDVPIITVFNPTEIIMDEIPFPGVTVCNVNNIRKGKVDEYKNKAIKGLNNELSEETLLQAFATLLDIHHICASATTFTERFLDSEDSVLDDSDKKLRETMDARYSDYKKYIRPTVTLEQGSQSCNEMILFCLWLDEIVNCSDIFQPIDTDYGYCCTFNTIPLTLLMKFSEDKRDDPEKVKAWSEANLTTDNLLFKPGRDPERKYPLRQLYPGRPAGLSILLDPDLDEYFCSNTDSEGFVASLNLPLDFPRMKDNGIAVRTDSEVFISVKPSVTFSDPSVQTFDLADRQCYYGDEHELPNYTKYTVSNCMDECIATQTLKKCGCVRYYMPGGYNEKRLCEPSSYSCTEEVRKKVIQRGLEEACKQCLPPCSEIEYTAETTSLTISNKSIDKLFSQSKNAHMARPKKPSIMHVYINVDSIFPRLRKEFTTKTELMSNAGGLLGLCMGFSVLSFLEIIYYCTMRVACRFYRRQSLNEIAVSDIEPGGLNQDTTMDLNNISKNKKGRNSWFRNILAPSDEIIGRQKNSNEENSKQPSALPDYFREPFESDFSKKSFGLPIIEETLGKTTGNITDTSVIRDNNYYNWRA